MNFNSFARTTDILHRALDVASLRYSVTSNNLANVDLPNFKRSNINFESELKRAFDSEKNAKDSFWANTRRPSRIQPGVIDYKTVKPRQVLDYLSVEKANGNNVNPEEEAMNVLKVQMQYQLLTMMTSFQYNQVQSVLK